MPVAQATESDNAGTRSAADSRVSSAMSASAAKPRASQADQKQQKKPAAAKPQTHTVKKGDNLGRIASRYGVTVDAIRQANGIKGDNIQIGQKLTIPAKGSTSSKSKSKKRSSRRR